MGARSVVGSFLLVIPLVISCSTRSPERESAAAKDAATGRDPAPATEGATPEGTAPAPAAGAEQAGPKVAITWNLVPTRMEGALALTDSSGGARSEVFSAMLPLGCEGAPAARGALLAARCMGSLVGPDGAVQLTARRAQKELIVSATGPLAAVAAGLPADKSGAEAKGAQKPQVLGRIALSPDIRTIRQRTGASDAARAGELLLEWSFATYHDVHVVIERPGAAGAKVEQFVTELPGCDPAGPATTLEADTTATLACRHRGRTATLTARLQPGFVLVTHVVSGEGLEQHQVDAQEIPLPAAPAAGPAR